nr:PH and SEC7 domain-containing protein 1 [Ciona intestinalis]|eukprot:XP_002121390.1 PH and SEC7 domain-containing protein 1 [Ciona intestinalis]
MDIESMRSLDLDGPKSSNIGYYSNNYNGFEHNSQKCDPSLLQENNLNSFTSSCGFTSRNVQMVIPEQRNSFTSGSNDESLASLTKHVRAPSDSETDTSSSVFDVSRFPENSENPGNTNVKKVLNEARNGYTVHEKMERRDSGFHTMTRNHDGSERPLTVDKLKIGKSNSDIVMSKPIVVKSALSLPIEETAPIRRHRSSPLMQRKTQRQNIDQDQSDQKMDDLARRLFYLDGYQKNEVMKHLSKKEAYSEKLSMKYMEFLELSNQSLEDGLRLLLKRLALLGETQERERVLSSFSKQFVQRNPTFLRGDLDATHTLVCAIALLNTDLNGVKATGRRRMTCKQFINNLAGMGPDGGNFPTDTLKEIYRSIKKKPLPWCEEKIEIKSRTRSGATARAINKSAAPKSASVSRSQSMNQPTRSHVRPLPVSREDSGVLRRELGGGRNSKTKTLPRKQGVLWRKAVVESDGNKTAKRKRKWKLYIVALQGLELQVVKKDSVSSQISLHHCVAEVEENQNATKRRHVFRITLADTSVALYQTNSLDEQKQWVDCINRNTALLSAAPLSAGVGSQYRFQKPLHPSHSSTLPVHKQLQDQQERLKSLYADLEELRNEKIDKNRSDSEKKYREDKETYLVWEIRKYELYTNTLEGLMDSTQQRFNELQKVVEEDEPPDSHSLLSVSPSEPGSYFPSVTENCESGNLSSSSDAQHHPRSPLSPASSLPNLIPMSVHRFPVLDVSSSLRNSSSASSGSYEPDPTIKITPPTEQQASANSNNSNAVIMLERVNLKADISSNKSESLEETDYPPKPPHSSTLPKPKSNLITTSILSSSFSTMPKQFPSRTAVPIQDYKDFPRIRGRKERKGASRYSYLQAVHDVDEIN